MPSNHLSLCHPLLLLPSIFPSIRVFSSESVLCIRWPKYWSFSFSISSSNECSGLISFTIDWFDQPWEGTQRKREIREWGNYWPGEEVVLWLGEHKWGRQGPLAGSRIAWTSRGTVESPGSMHEWGAQAWPQDRWRETCSRGCQVSPVRAKWTFRAPLTPHHMATLDLGPRSGKRIYWGCIWVGWWLSLLVATQEVPQGQPRSLAVSYSSIVVHYPAMSDERPHRPPSLIHIVIPQQGGGLWKLQAVIGCEEQRGLEPKAVIDHNHRGLHRHLALWPILCL